MMGIVTIRVINTLQNNVWFTGSDETMKELHDFVQYVLDSCSKPETYKICFYDVDCTFSVGLIEFADLSRMKKRVFSERMKDTFLGDCITYQYIRRCFNE